MKRVGESKLYTMIKNGNAYNLQVLRGLKSNKSLLSTDGGGSVQCWNRDDGSGRQQWVLEPAEGGHYVTITNGVDPSPKYLHYDQNNSNVSMVNSKIDDREVWLVEEVPNSPTCNTYYLKPKKRSNMMLSASPEGQVDIYDKDDGSGRQRWQFQNHWVTPQN